MATKYQTGMQGQRGAEAFLLANGYNILERNYRIRTGEVDLIAEQNEYIVFIEVKTRKGLKFGLPCESVSIKKRQRIVHTAMHYISVKNLDNHNFRFDVMEVYADTSGVQVNHIENAFDAW